MKLGTSFSLAGTQVLGAEDKNVTLDVGDSFIVELPGAEGSGYGWTLSPGVPWVVDTTDGKTFVAKGPGTTRLVFAYHHPFENRTPIKTVTINVQVDRIASHWKTLLGVGVGLGAAAGVIYAATRKKRKR